MNEIKIHKGRSLDLTVTVKDEDGNPVDLTSQKHVRLAVRDGRDGEIVIEKDGFTAANTAHIYLKPADTADLDCGTYHYDIGVQYYDGSGDYRDIIEWADFMILPSASRKEED